MNQSMAQPTTKDVPRISESMAPGYRVLVLPAPEKNNKRPTAAFVDPAARSC